MSIYENAIERINREIASSPADADWIVLATEDDGRICMTRILRMVPCPPEPEVPDFWPGFDQIYPVWIVDKVVQCYVTWGYQCQQCKQTFFRARGANIAAFRHDCKVKSV